MSCVDNNNMERLSLKEIILSHFDQFQRREINRNNGNNMDMMINSPRSPSEQSSTKFDFNKINVRTDAEVRAVMIRKDISYFKRINKLDTQAKTSKKQKSSDGDDASLSTMMDNLTIETSCTKTKKEILDALLYCINAAFILAAQTEKSAEEAIQNTLDLAAASICTIDPKDGHICNAILSHVGKFVISKEDAVRAKACMFFGFSLSYFHSSRTSSALTFRDTSTETILNLIHPRLIDKSKPVRLTAIKACGFITSCDSSYLSSPIVDNIITALMETSKHDSSFGVRASALQCLPINSETLPVVLGRIRDVKDKVRLAALEVLRTSKDVDVFEDLTVDSRIEILRNGLSNRCKNTKIKTVELLCTNWLKAVKFDPIELLKLLDPSDVENESVCENAIRALFSVAWETDSNISASNVLKELSNPEIRAFKDNIETVITSINDETLEPAHALYLRVKCSIIKESRQFTAVQKVQQIQNICVDIPVLCEVLMNHVENLKGCIKDGQDPTNEVDGDESDRLEENQCFICLQILKMSLFTDLQEEGSRRHFLSILRDILTTIDSPDVLLESCIHVMLMTYTDESVFVKDISKILQDILISSSSTENLSSIESQIMASSTETKMRMANILLVVLEKISKTNTEDDNLNSFHTLIMPMVTSENVTIKEAGVSCLGKFALLSGEGDVVEQFQSILVKLANNPREKDPVRAQAALSLCDLALLFQPDSLGGNPLSKLEQDTTSLITSLMQQFGDEEVMTVITAEICIKLMIANKFHNAEILSNLLVMFFDTNYFSASSLSSGDDWRTDVKEVGSPTRLLQMLSVFLPAYAMSNKIAQTTLIASIQPLLVSTSLRIKSKKTKSSVMNVKKMIGYISSITNVNVNLEQNEMSEKGVSPNTFEVNKKIMLISIMIAKAMYENHSNFSKVYNRTLCRTLGATIATLEDTEVDEGLYTVLKDNIENIGDITDDELVQQEFDEISEIIDTMKIVHPNEFDESHKNNQDEELLDKLNQVTLQDDPRKSEKNDNIDHETIYITRSGRRTRRSNESIQSSNSLQNASPTRSSIDGFHGLEVNTSLGDITCQGETKEECKLDLENISPIAKKDKETTQEGVSSTRRHLATLNV